MAESTDNDPVPQLVEVSISEVAKPYASKLTELTNAANLQYSLKKYNEAAELYSEATELQAELNGEMAPENAELLYLYGRCLYKVAVAKSDVLGGQVAAEKKKQGANGETSQSKAGASSSLPSKDQRLAEEVVEAAVEAKDESKAPDSKLADKPYFEIIGDDNWDTESDEEAEGQAEEAAEDEDDFANAYEILDIARVLLQRQVETLQSDQENGSLEDNGKGKASGRETMSSGLRHIKERLADTFDLQAEISLENENFKDAIEDSSNAAALKDELFPKESSMVAEAHYKLSLALEFASVTELREAQAKEGDAAAASAAEKAQVDEKMREEAAKEMEIAIESCKLRVEKEEQELRTLEGEGAKEKDRSIKEVKEIIEDMEQRLIDLRGPPVSVSNINGPAGAPEANPMAGILAQMLGESQAEQKARIDDATKNANDISGLVRHKKKPKPNATNVSTTAEAGSATNGKRKLEDVDEGAESEGKKARLRG